MLDECVRIALDGLRQLREAHCEIGRLIITAHGGDEYPVDLLATAVLNRSMGLLRGFCDLVASENFVAAAPLLRLQLDNCTRF